MASNPSGNVTNNIAGNQLTYTDTGTYGTVSSRILTIFDPNGTLLSTIDMGSSLTAPYTITADQYLRFICTVADDVSGSPWVTTVNYLAQGFYTVAYLNRLVQSDACCESDFNNLDIAEKFLAAAQRFGVAGLGIAANNEILAANIYVNLQT